MKLLAKYVNKRNKQLIQKYLKMKILGKLYAKGAGVVTAKKLYYYAMDVIWDTTWIVWYLHLVVFLEVGGFVQLVRRLV